MVHPSQPARIKTRIFLSYSRKDASFAIWLRQQLEARDIEVFRDVDDTLPGEQWWARLVDLIAKADTVVFALSPHSAASKVCADEVAKALSLNKRIVPALLADVDWEAVPEGLAKVHSVIFTNEADRDSRVEQLVTALNTDIAWVREHTRLGEISGRWASARTSDLLLRGRELEVAETWLTRQPPTAAPPTPLHLAFIKASRDAARRRQRWVAGLSVSAAVVSIGLGLFAEVQRELAQSNEKKATIARDRALLNQSQLLADKSRQKLNDGDSISAVELALSALPGRNAGGEGRPYVPEAEAALFAATFSNREIAVLSGRNGPLVSYDVSADTTRIVATDGSSVQVWDGATGAPLTTLTVDDGQHLSLVVLAPDGGHVAGAAADGTVLVWAMADGMRAGSVKPASGIVKQISFSDDAQRLVAVYADGTIALLKMPSGQTIATLHLPPSEVMDATFVPGAARLVVHAGPIVKVLNSVTGEAIATLADGASWSNESRADDIKRWTFLLACPGSGQVIVKSTFDQTRTRLQSFTASVGARMGTWESASGDIVSGFSCIPGSPNSADSQIAVHTTAPAGAADRIHLLDCVTLAQRKAIDLGGKVWGLDQSTGTKLFPDGRRLLTVDYQNAAQVWNLENGQPVGEPMKHALGIGTTAIAADGTVVATATDDGSLGFWNAATGKLNLRLKGHLSKPQFIRVRADQARVITASFAEGTVRLWDTAPQSGALSTLAKPPGSFGDSALDVDGVSYSGLAGAGRATVLRRIDAKSLTMAPPEPLPAALSDGNATRLSHDGRFLMGLSTDRTSFVIVDRSKPAEAAKQLPLSADMSGATAHFSASASTIVAATKRQIRAFDPVSLQALASFDCVECVRQGSLLLTYAFRPDGKQIAVEIVRGPARTEVIVYNLPSGIEVGRINPGGRIAYFPDGSRLLVNPVKGLEVYDTATLQRRLRINETSWIGAASVSADNRKIMAVVNRRLVKVWDARSGGELAGLSHPEDISDATFTPDQSRIISLAYSRIYFWRYFPTAALMIDHARAALPRCLTPEQRTQALLEPIPPEWCITGLGHEDDPDPTHWTPKWPYQAAAWREWLIAKRARHEQPLPIAER